ncbi:thiosulfate dehydrogenase [quinone] large subunit [Nakamurella panacisegetis]|uniref:Thiosulfate dehydrogenase [quinone] large subunit n=1 Tax=Nakamurella panacisegetis TaxID=1090615 RepID=A0A1H0S905_9ACTN|nr:DoxX family protein [Nakamurella panacisegetis]SDP38262.1 thiosulfate dehydrogenase [quinone] large subunit [Nakamurella panacisegetis]
MSTDERRSVRVPVDQGGAAAAVETRVSPVAGMGRPHWSVELLRFGLGWVFLWAFADKAFGWGYSTQSSQGWVRGGSPTRGFLSHVEVGPWQSGFRSMAGNGWADWLFMIGLLGIGVALITGVLLRVAAVAGSILLVLMWVAEWPMARFTSTGTASGSTNPFLDYHLIFAVGLIVVATLGVGSAWGLGRWWSRRPVVQQYRILR